MLKAFFSSLLLARFFLYVASWDLDDLTSLTFFEFGQYCRLGANLVKSDLPNNLTYVKKQNNKDRSGFTSDM